MTNSITEMTDDDLAAFVIEYCNGKILTSADVRDKNLISKVFMIISLGGLDEMTEEKIKDIGCIWEHISEAGPMSINNYPIFMSCHIMNKNDWVRAIKAIDHELKRREESKKKILNDL